MHVEAARGLRHVAAASFMNLLGINEGRAREPPTWNLLRARLPTPTLGASDVPEITLIPTSTAGGIIVSAEGTTVAR